MSTPSWHQLCTLREDVQKGTLTLAEFAADLNDVRTGDAPLVYRDPGLFFDRTYPTYNMKGLAREVLLRLAGQGGRPVLRLQVAYGGGKTHTLITLLHLAECGATLADHRTVKEFAAFAGISPLPGARVALLPGDKFDVKDGLEVYGPDGKPRRVKTLWGALAHQLAGDVGYARLKAHDEDFTVPAEPLLVDLLRIPLQEGQGVLVLVDEAVWYYRGLVNDNPRTLGTIQDFYQVLTQAVAKVDRAALVASLLASQAIANDPTGTQCLAALEDVFGRVSEPVEPVGRDDIAEVLRRRLFERVPGEAERRPAVDAVFAAMQSLPLRDAQRDQAAYNRLMESYPFHPDLINVLYQKWTQLGGFQRTRGALRLLAYALRDSEGDDPTPLVGPGALLPYQGIAPRPRNGGLSPALNELVEIVPDSERWGPILRGELDKAREIQVSLPTLRAREIEQAVVATFLHSQPLGQRAAPTDLLALLAHPTIDPAALEEGLRKWRDLSWFLSEDPTAWQLSTTPNLTHVHFQAMGALKEPEIDDELERRIRAAPGLAAADPDVLPHNLPESPRAVGDDTQLHYVVLGPAYAVEPAKPLPAAVEAFFKDKSGPHDPRIYPNNVIALVPEVARIAGLREQVRRWLGWTRIEASPETIKLLTDAQKKQLPKRKQEAATGLPEAVVAAYTILVAMDENGQVKTFPLRGATAVNSLPFERIKALLTEEERLITTTLDPQLLLPGSYLNLWPAGQPSRRVTDLLEAFGQFPRLPRLLRPQVLYESLKRGVREGALVLRLPRPDGSAQTWWRFPPDDDLLRRPGLEVVPVTQAALSALDPDLLAPERSESLWPATSDSMTLANLRALFDGTHAPRLERPDVLDQAVRTAVQRGVVMARLGNVTWFRESLVDGPLPADLELMPSPAPLRGADLTLQGLPEAWNGQEVTLSAIAHDLEASRGYPIPWTLLSSAVDEALQLRLFEPAPGSGPWPSSPVTAEEVRFRVIENVQITPELIVAALDYAGSGAPTLRTIKERLESQFLSGREVPTDLFVNAVKAAVREGLLEAEGAADISTATLTTRVRRPVKALYAEAVLDPMALQRLAERIEELLAAAPELSLSFRIVLAAEGQSQDPVLLERLNEVLGQIQAEWKLT